MKNKELKEKLKLLKKKLKIIKKSKESVEIKELDNTETLIKEILKYEELGNDKTLLKQLNKALDMLKLYKYNLTKFKELEKKWS